VIIRRLPADTPIPADATRYPEPLVAVSNQLWLLLATRRHPDTGVINALLRGIDDHCMAVVPAWAVDNFTAPDVELAKQEAGIKQEPKPGTVGMVRPHAPDPHRPVNGMDLAIAKFAALFDGTELHIEEPINV